MVFCQMALQETDGCRSSNGILWLRCNYYINWDNGCVRVPFNLTVSTLFFFGWPIHVKLVALSCLTPGNERNYEKHCKEKAKFANYTHQEKAFTRRCRVCSTFGILNCINSWNQIPLFILPPEAIETKDKSLKTRRRRRFFNNGNFV